MSANNDFASRIALTPGTGSFSGSTIGDNTQSGEPVNVTNPNAGKTSWWSLTLSEPKIYRFKATSITANSKTMATYLGTAVNALTRQVSDWTVAGGGQQYPSTLLFSTGNVGTWYEFQFPTGESEIQIGQAFNQTGGAFAVDFEELTRPANDDFVDAEDFGADSGAISADTEGATYQTAQAHPGIVVAFDTPRADLWYTFTPSVDGVYTFQLAADGSATQILYAVYSGSTLGSLTVVGYGFADELTKQFLLVGGTEYHIAVVGYMNIFVGPTDRTRWRGPFTLTWDNPPTPANDNLIYREILDPSGGTSTQATTLGATRESGEVAYYGEIGGSVWFDLVPDTSGRWLLTINNMPPYPVFGRLFAWSGDDFDSFVTEGLGIVGGTPPVDFPFNLRAGKSYKFQLTLADVEVDTGEFGPLDYAFDTAAPSNDDFANAEVISGASGSTAGTCLGATREDDEPLAYFWNALVYGSVWYEWTCPGDGYYSFDTLGSGLGGNYADVSMSVYTGSALDALTRVVGNQDGTDVPYPTTDTKLVFLATSGTVYKIQVDVGADAAEYDFTLNWDTATQPANDDFANAEALVGLSGSTSGSNYGADIAEEDEPDLVTLLSLAPADVVQGRSVWYSFAPPTDGTYEFTIGVPAQYILYGFFRDDGVDGLTFLAGSEGGFGDDVEQVVLSSDESYYLMVTGTGYYLGSYPQWTVEQVSQGVIAVAWVRIPTPPANDVFNANFLDNNHIYNLTWTSELAAAGCRRFSNVDSTADASEPNHAGQPANKSVWFYFYSSFEGDTADWEFWVTSSELTDPVMSIYEYGSNIATLVSVAEDDDSFGGTMPMCTLTPAAFDEYLIAVDVKAGGTEEGAFTLNWRRVPPGTPPANDDWANAEAITGATGTVSGNLNSATGECTEPVAPFSGLAEGRIGVWYAYTAPYDAEIQFDLTSLTGAPWYPGVTAEVFTGATLETLVSLNAGDSDYPDTPDPEEPTSFFFNAGVGVTYYIQLMAYPFQNPDVDYEMSWTLASGTTPSNDDFANAQVVTG